MVSEVGRGKVGKKVEKERASGGRERSGEM